MALLVPSKMWTQETIPLTLKEGDVISAAVINSILKRIESATNSLTSDDLVGSWTITQIVPFNGQPGNGNCRSSSVNPCLIAGTTDAPDGMSRSRTDVVTIAKNGAAYTYAQVSFSSFTAAHTNTPLSGTVSVIGEAVVFRDDSFGNFAYFYARKKSASKIVLQDIQSVSSAFNMVIMDKRNTVPTPPNELSAAASNKSVALAWMDQSADETGFKIQRKTSVSGTWVDVFTTAANANVYTDSGLAPGTYWYRVLATNGNGDSTTSSEVQVIVK